MPPRYAALAAIVVIIQFIIQASCDMPTCSVSTPAGNVSTSWFQSYGNVSDFQVNNTPAVLTVSLCVLENMSCGGAPSEPAYLQISTGPGCSIVNVFSEIASPLAYDDTTSTATLQLIDSINYANINIRCQPGISGLKSDLLTPSYFDSTNAFNLFLISEEVCPGWTNTSSDGDNDKLSKAETAGIVIFIFVIVVIISVVIVRIRTKRSEYSRM